MLGPSHLMIVSVNDNPKLCGMVRCAVLLGAVLLGAVLCCAVMCCAVLCCAACCACAFTLHPHNSTQHQVPASVRYAKGYNPANTRLGQPC